MHNSIIIISPDGDVGFGSTIPSNKSDSNGNISALTALRDI
jgi:hypothetical protein